MKRNRVGFIFLVFFLLFSCASKNTKVTFTLAPPFGCEFCEMQQSMHEMGTLQNLPKLKKIEPGFTILVDTTNLATNFVSRNESYCSRKAIADSIHTFNNNGKVQVWIMNNSNDSVAIQMQDDEYISVLQAKAKNGNWYTIEFYRFSFCGNSYYYMNFPPRTANSFVIDKINRGDFKTKLRYKLLGKEKFYYSNEFDGNINYCEFIESPLIYNSNNNIPKSDYKLTRFINVVN